VSALAIAGLAKRFGKATALDGIDLEVGPGELFVILGPTNAGKSTLLKAVAGLVRPDAGSIALGGRRLDPLPPRERNLSLLFQNNALFPTLTAFENLAFPLRAAGVPVDEIGRQVAEIAALLKIEHLLDRHPRTFSGGEQQRVAIGRAIIRPGALLMLDEPLANLDARLRIALRLAFKRMHAAGGQTMLYVTHDQVEAMSLADRIGILDQGRFRQIGRPAEIYQRPATAFVARFVGAQPMNLLPATLEGGPGDVPVLSGAGFRLPMPEARSLTPSARPRALAIGVRAEEIAVAPQATAATPFPARTVWSEHLGAHRVLDLRLGDSLVKAQVPRTFHAAPDQEVWIGFAPQPHRLLDRDSERFLAPPAGEPSSVNQGGQP
jgi:ABC-type sugar transport system ATPase subunit